MLTSLNVDLHIQSFMKGKFSLLTTHSRWDMLLRKLKSYNYLHLLNIKSERVTHHIQNCTCLFRKTCIGLCMCLLKPLKVNKSFTRMFSNVTRTRHSQTREVSGLERLWERFVKTHKMILNWSKMLDLILKKDVYQNQTMKMMQIKTELPKTDNNCTFAHKGSMLHSNLDSGPHVECLAMMFSFTSSAASLGSGHMSLFKTTPASLAMMIFWAFVLM